MQGRGATKLLIGSATILSLSRGASGHAPFEVDPFTLGVASGAHRPNAVTLWTRLAPRPLEPAGGMDPVAHDVDGELAADDHFPDVVARGTVTARPELAHSVRVTVQGLAPSRPYWYRFLTNCVESGVGPTRTLPDPSAPLPRVRFATASCQHVEQGYFSAYDPMIEDDSDVVVHLGDYIYGVSRGDFRQHTRKEVPQTLEDYRRRHALYKTDPSLQRAHAAFPFITVLGNHDARKNAPLAPEQVAQRRAAYHAWFEHMPMEGG